MTTYSPGLNTSGNVNGQATMANSAPVVIASNQTTFPVTTSLSTAILSADGLSNPTTAPVISFNAGYNGTTWDRIRTIPSTDAQGSTGIQANALMGFNGTTYDRIRTASSDALSTTGWLAAGNILYNGVGWDRQRSIPSADAQSTTGFAGMGILGFNGTTYDRLRLLNNSDAITTPTGMLGAFNTIYNGTSWDRMRSVSSADAQSNTGYAGVGNLFYNGTTWDRARSLNNADAITTMTGMPPAPNLLYNGTNWDRLRSMPTGDTVAVTGFTGAGILLFNGSTYDRMRSMQAGDSITTGVFGSYLYNNASYDRPRSIINSTNSTGTGIQAVGLTAQLDDTSPSTITENQFGALRLSGDRSLITTPRATTPSQTSVAGNSISVSLLASNNNRKGATITNDSSAVLYIKLGSTASTTSYTVSVAGSAAAPFTYYEVPFGYVGAIDGIWASSTGNARITELT